MRCFQAKDIHNLVDTSIGEFGKVDILVNNAGITIIKPAEEINEEDWDQVIDINLKGVFMLAQAVGKIMISQKNGKIINISSVLGHVGEKYGLPYICSKGAVLQMTKGLALEWAKHNIQVNAVAPGFFKTPMNTKQINDEKALKNIIARTPMRRMGEIQEIVGTVVFLASEASNYITGTCIAVDGGWLAQ